MNVVQASTVAGAKSLGRESTQIKSTERMGFKAQEASIITYTWIQGYIVSTKR